MPSAGATFRICPVELPPQCWPPAEPLPPPSPPDTHMQCAGVASRLRPCVPPPRVGFSGGPPPPP
eukprot:scaffold470270_cov18-Prasinocladus_malaysianus.AAC.1